MADSPDKTRHVEENVDKSELSKFEVPLARWWDPEGEFKPLHRINPLRLEFINQRSPLAGKKVLDVGCGGGILSEAMAAAGAQVTGIDISDDILDVARSHAADQGLAIDYRCVAVEKLARSSPEQWDIVTCMEALEHVPEPGRMVKSCAAMLAPEGTAYFSTFNRNLKSFLHAIVGAEYILRLLPKGTHDYGKFIRPYELLKWCETSSIHLVDIKGISYNPIFDTYSIEKAVDVNYIAQAVRSESTS